MQTLQQIQCTPQATDSSIEFADAIDPSECPLDCPEVVDLAGGFVHVHLACCGAIARRQSSQGDFEDGIARCTGSCGDYLHACAAEIIEPGDLLCSWCARKKEQDLMERDLLFRNVAIAREDLSDALERLQAEPDSIDLLRLMPDLDKLRATLETLESAVAAKVARSANLLLPGVA